MREIVLKVPDRAYGYVSEIFETKEELLRDFLSSITLAKVSDYKKREEVYERKYNMAFEEFKKRVLDKHREEIFEEWDDYIIWKALHKAHKLWIGKYEGLRKCFT